MRQTFDASRHCGAKRRACDSKVHEPGFDTKRGQCDHIGEAHHRGAPCLQAKGKGTDHVGSGRCSLHVGKTPPGHKEAANERASKLLVGLGQPVPIDPQQALLRMVHWAYGRLNAIVEQISAALDAPTPDAAFISSLKDEFGDALDRVTRTSKVTIDADIAERAQKLEEADGQRIRALFTGALDAYEAASKPSPRARKVATDYLIAEMRRIDEQPVGLPN